LSDGGAAHTTEDESGTGTVARASPFGGDRQRHGGDLAPPAPGTLMTFALIVLASARGSCVGGDGV
jgi:hypothetical protein